MSKAQSRLGRGLGSLITTRRWEDPANGAPVSSSTATRQIPISEIRPSSRQARKTFDATSMECLAESIRASGVLQPVIVRPTGSGAYELVAGERRWRAAQSAGLDSVPAVVRELSDSEAVEIGLIENLQREDLNALERAAAYRDYMQAFSVTADELARRLGESRANVSNYLRILSLSDEIKGLISNGSLGMGQARAVAGIEDKNRQLAVARLAARRNLAVRQVEALARGGGVSSEAQEVRSRSRPRHIADVEGAFSRALGLVVRVYAGKKKNSGRVVIRYESLEDFDRIAERLGGGTALE